MCMHKIRLMMSNTEFIQFFCCYWDHLVYILQRDICNSIKMSAIISDFISYFLFHLFAMIIFFYFSRASSLILISICINQNFDVLKVLFLYVVSEFMIDKCACICFRRKNTVGKILYLFR